MKLIHVDERIVVCIKPAGIKSTDEPGGLPELIRQALGDAHAQVLTVHRLDQAVSGLMVLARTRRAASELSQQIREGSFGKEYLAVIHGTPREPQGTLEDLLYRDKQRRMTLVVPQMGKDVQPASLSYRVIATNGSLSKVAIRLHTGRTHQIRVQFASRGMSLVGERKYSTLDDGCDIALWSHRLTFTHPKTGELLEFTREPPDTYPWNVL